MLPVDFTPHLLRRSSGHSRICCESCQGEWYPAFAATSLIDRPGSCKKEYARNNRADTTSALAEKIPAGSRFRYSVLRFIPAAVARSWAFLKRAGDRKS